MWIDTFSPPGTAYVPPHQDADDRCLGFEASKVVRPARLPGTGRTVGLSSSRRVAPAVGAASSAKATMHTRYVGFLFICALPDGRARCEQAARSTFGSGDLERERYDLRRTLVSDGQPHRQLLATGLLLRDGESATARAGAAELLRSELCGARIALRKDRGGRRPPVSRQLQSGRDDDEPLAGFRPGRRRRLDVHRGDLRAVCVE